MADNFLYFILVEKTERKILVERDLVSQHYHGREYYHRDCPKVRDAVENDKSEMYNFFIKVRRITRALMGLNES